MSLKRYAMLAAISYFNQQHNKTQQEIAATTELTTTTATRTIKTLMAIPAITTKAAPTAAATTTIATEKIINSNKSTLIQLKQQSQHQQQQLQQQQHPATLTPPPATSSPTSSTTTTTATRWFNSDNPTLYSDHRHNTHTSSNSSSSVGVGRGGSGVHVDSTVNDSTSVESSESTNVSRTNLNSGADDDDDDGQRHHQQQQPHNTYGTTYYGSGFGVFHQQNIRSNGGTNGGGIALITGGSGNGLGSTSYSNGINNNVNLLLGGAMLTLITTILCVVCYCCHRNIKKRTEAAYRQQRQWLENDPNMEIYSVEQCYETSGLFVGDSMDGLATIPALHHEPPPSYDAVVAMQEQQQLIMQQQQQQHQQLMMQQQQQLMQQLPNNSPPPGYRSSLDVSSMIPGRSVEYAASGGFMEPTSLASSSLNLRASSSRSPIEALGNYNDFNGNMTAAAGSIQMQQQPNYLRNKQMHPRNLPPTAAANLTQLNMKKVLQAQSCCSLQRAEVENMWNAAAAALAARSAHNPTTTTSSNERPTTASTSSPTLVMNTRSKLAQGHTGAQATAPPAETFGSRYLKQNYYRRGCPLCGKFRYDNDSTFSISVESNLDSLTTVIGNPTVDEEYKENEEDIMENSINKNFASNIDENANGHDDNDDDENANQEDEEAETEECSCVNTNRQQQSKKYQKLFTQTDGENNIRRSERSEDLESPNTITDDNCNNNSSAEEEQRQSAIIFKSETNLPSNNNNDLNTEPSCSTLTIATTSSAAEAAISSAASSSCPSSSSSSASAVTIDLNCINENGIISLDMSKIIDKTGLPTYDAALKLESSGYV